jgi:hypothetical protein
MEAPGNPCGGRESAGTRFGWLWIDDLKRETPGPNPRTGRFAFVRGLL